jgi:hypothetical protein
MNAVRLIQGNSAAAAFEQEWNEPRLFLRSYFREIFPELLGVFRAHVLRSPTFRRFPGLTA